MNGTDPKELAMSQMEPGNRLELPRTLENQLLDFRRVVWKIKLIEGVCIAVCGLLCGYLAVFVLDRLWETPRVGDDSLHDLSLDLEAAAAGSAGATAKPEDAADGGSTAGGNRAGSE